jgi:hypothetical protein
LNFMMRQVYILLPLLLMFGLLASLPAEGQTQAAKKEHEFSNLDTESADILAADLASESADGASNYATCLSNGRLSAGISPWGELTFLRWPNLTYNEHLRYFTIKGNQITPFLFGKLGKVRMGDDAEGPDWRLYGRPYVKHIQLGSRGGVYTNGEGMVWFFDPALTSSRRFESHRSPVFITRVEGEAFWAEVADGILPDNDLMVRAFTISPGPRKFFYQGTFAPSVESPAYLGREDHPGQGFAAAYCPKDDLIIHFRPMKNDPEPLEKADPGKITPEMLDMLYPQGGAFLAWGFMERSSGFQVGADISRHPKVASEKQGGFFDPEDGSLSGNPVWRGSVDAAMSMKLNPNELSDVTLLIAMAGSAEMAADMIKEARSRGADDLFNEINKAWNPVAESIIIPDEADQATARVARRSVLNLLQGQDAKSGAIVASLSRQPSYHYDWPRDGAFFDLALDMAGFSDQVSRHIDFYTRTQRRGNIAFNPIMLFAGMNPFYNPAGHFFGNLAVDGQTKSIMDIPLPFEIDETGLLLWDFWRHEKYLSEAERPAYQARTRETLELAADAALRFVDMEKGWVKKAYEDDHFPASATYHGASSVLTGLCAAVDAGRRWGVPQEKVEKWAEAASALHSGMIQRLDDKKAIQRAGWRGLQWALWPAPLFKDMSDPRAKPLIDRLAKQVDLKIAPESPGFAYLGEQIFILALAAKDCPEYDQLLEQALKVFTHEAPVRGADCYGEVVLWGEFAGDGTRVTQNRTAIPHLWNGITAYLAVMAIYEPEKFQDLRPPMP